MRSAAQPPRSGVAGNGGAPSAFEGKQEDRSRCVASAVPSDPRPEDPRQLRAISLRRARSGGAAWASPWWTRGCDVRAALADTLAPVSNRWVKRLRAGHRRAVADFPPAGSIGQAEVECRDWSTSRSPIFQPLTNSSQADGPNGPHRPQRGRPDRRYFHQLAKRPPSDLVAVVRVVRSTYPSSSTSRACWT